MEIQPRRLSGPEDLGFADAERERQERFGELEQQLTGTIDALREGEERRDHSFRENEDERDRLFAENENRRDQEALQRRDEILRDLEDRIEDRLAAVAPGAGAPPIPVPPPGGPRPETEAEVPVLEEGAPMAAETQSVIESVRSVQDAATRHAQEILDTVRMEREEQAHEREMAQAERERVQAEKDAEHARQMEEQQARIRALEEELASVKAELANERQLRLTEESEGRERDRADFREQVDALRNQMADVTNIASETRDEVARKSEVSDQRWTEKLAWKEEKDAKSAQLREMVEQVIADREACKAEKAERREADTEDRRRSKDSTMSESMLSVSKILGSSLMDIRFAGWRADCAHYHEMTMEAVRATAQERIPFNIQTYLDEFSKSLAAEVRMLLGEVGKLREEKRNLQFELGCLLTMKSKYGPGGEFDPNWSAVHCRGCGGAPPPEAPPPPPPEEPIPARPAWRSVTHRGPRRSRRNQPAAAAPPEAPPQEVRPPVSSWATWQPDPHFVPTPPTVEPTLLAPPESSPGLFGPRSPRDSLHQE
ncbi:hypothetical protein BKA93DRAFT_723737 [Sparassis latifolia]